MIAKPSIGCLAALLSGMIGLACRADTTTVTYTYDALGRLQQVGYPGSKSIIYSYDKAGSRTKVVSTGLDGPVALDDDYLKPCAANALAVLLTNDGTTINSIDPRCNDTDANNYALSITSFSATQFGGTVTQNGDGTLKYVPPNASYSGPDSFTYVISDNHGGSAQATVTVAMNSPPTANPVSEINDGTVTNYNDVLSYDTDPDLPDQLVIVSPGGTAVSTAQGGSVTGNGASVTYTPPALPFHGTDTFSYTINDHYGVTGNLHTSTSTVTVDVNHPPVAVDDNVLVGLTSPPTATFDPRLNDTDPDGDPIKIKLADQTSAHGGTVVVNGTSSITYTPASGYHGSDTFNYTIRDDHNHTASAVVHLTVP